jgi:hypothetical protein
VLLIGGGCRGWLTHTGEAALQRQVESLTQRLRTMSQQVHESHEADKFAIREKSASLVVRVRSLAMGHIACTFYVEPSRHHRMVVWRLAVHAHTCVSAWCGGGVGLPCLSSRLCVTRS